MQLCAHFHKLKLALLCCPVLSQVGQRSRQFALLMSTISDLTATLNEDPVLAQSEPQFNADEKEEGRRGREEGEEEDDDDDAGESTAKRAKTA